MNSAILCLTLCVLHMGAGAQTYNGWNTQQQAPNNWNNNWNTYTQPKTAPRNQGNPAAAAPKKPTIAGAAGAAGTAGATLCDPANCVCHGELGCFRKRSHCMETRAPLPQTPAQIGTRFLLYKRGNRGIQPITTKMSSTALYAAGFDARKSTMVAVHGWTQSSSAFDGLKNVFLKKADYNVILVDWEKGAGITGRWPLAYTQPVQNTRVVGKQIAMLLSHIAAQTQIKLGTVHLIGASLGAQAAGYAGMYLNGTVGRISGLDPAKPNFEGQPIDCKLDKSDAHFVDVIHTDMDIAGVAESIGHIDFFPNGGRMQPGCNSAICSHLRAKSLFRASVWTDCQFQTTRCDGAPCGVSGCPPMGFNAFNPRETRKGDYCLTTTDKPPYCTDNMKNTKPSYPGKVNPSPGSGKPGKATWFNNGKPLPGGNRGNANKLFQEMGSSGVRHQMTFTISFTMFIVGLLARLL